MRGLLPIEYLCIYLFSVGTVIAWFLTIRIMVVSVCMYEYFNIVLNVITQHYFIILECCKRN